MNDSIVIDLFEKSVASYTHAPFGVAVSSQTNAVFLCLELLKSKGVIQQGDVIQVPQRTYMSIPMTIINAGCLIEFTDEQWSGCYQLHPTSIWDAAVRFTSKMYIPGSLFCVSFQYKKALPIGRGGMILTDNKEYYSLLKKLRFNGRTDGLLVDDDCLLFQGWNMYMTPEQAARGLTFMSFIKEHNEDIARWDDYPDVSQQPVFKQFSHQKTQGII